MKEPAFNHRNTRPLLYEVSPRRRRRPANMQKRRLRKHRVFLLGLAVGLLLTLLVLALQALIGFTSQAALAFQDMQTPQATTTEAIEGLLSRNLLLADGTSLLYQDRFNPMLREQMAAVSPRPPMLLPMPRTHEDADLKVRLQTLIDAYDNTGRYKTHFYYYNLQDGSYVNINGESPVSAASVIKLPILLDYLLSLDEKTLSTETPLLYANFHRASGAGTLQYRDTGVIFPANEVAAEMIRISDNTCTNMMISYLGGADAVNRRLAALGLVQTRIRNWLPDLTGTNTISAYEMASILYNIDQSPLLSETARNNGLHILESTHNRRLLVEPLPSEAVVAHKTGDIATAFGDSGVVYLPDGRRYIISIQIERPYNDYAPREMIQRTSRLLYDYVAAQPSSETLASRSDIPGSL